jgi:hypothetical protein
MPEESNGRLFALRFAPLNYEQLRKTRIEIALENKLPKLACWQASGAKSILILENGDMALTNHVAVADALEANLVNRTDKPDEIWFVDTTIKSEWTVLRTLSGVEWFPDDESSIRYRDFKPSDLSCV